MTGGPDSSFQHILIIDDDERLRLLLRRFLEESEFRVTDVGSAADARRVLDGIIFDLIIVDIMMPGETGLEFLADIRKANRVPALFLTAMAETEHRIAGLESGADDYMSKPFEPRELVLRIRSILARAATRPGRSDISINFGPYSFDLNTGILMHSSGRIHITTAEQKLLSSFAARPDMVLSRDDIATAMNSRAMANKRIDEPSVQPKKVQPVDEKMRLRLA